MEATEPQPGGNPLAAEWERIELLAWCLAESRGGRDVPPDSLDRLRGLQARVEEIRCNGTPWSVVRDAGLGPLAYDVLACAVAPEAEPRLGWVFQNLQAGIPQPYPTAALIQDLLALEGSAAGELYAAIADGAPLRRHALIELEGDGPYQPIRPAAGLAARLLGRPEPDLALPGATRIRMTADWDDLVLPADAVAGLGEFLLWVRHRHTVVGEWGGRPAGAPVALFSGPSGTGKTFAAVVIATDLAWPLYRVDLGRLVSKYIGETEKNLNRLFDRAHGQPVVLQFDEADALFGRRGEVTEARDRYANMEVSHLLARVESHEGPCILTTNMRDNLDPAFARRFQVVVDFPRPDVEARCRLWERLLPPRAPREPDVQPDALGRAVNLTGGGILNVALHAAYLAAGAGEPIRLSHVALAAWRELRKEGREVSLTELGPLAGHLPEGTPC